MGASELNPKSKHISKIIIGTEVTAMSSGYFLVVQLVQGGSVTNQATQSRLFFTKLIFSFDFSLAREYNREVTSGAKISACYWPDLAPIERLRSALQFPLGQQCRKVCSGNGECFS